MPQTSVQKRTPPALDELITFGNNLLCCHVYNKKHSPLAIHHAVYFNALNSHLTSAWSHSWHPPCRWQNCCPILWGRQQKFQLVRPSASAIWQALTGQIITDIDNLIVLQPTGFHKALQRTHKDLKQKCQPFENNVHFQRHKVDDVYCLLK